MQFIRQLYNDLPSFIPIPSELKHSKAEVIILPLDSNSHQEVMKSEQTTFKLMLDELQKINNVELIEMDEPIRVDRANPFLDEDL